jgi:hypothetical protein
MVSREEVKFTKNWFTNIFILEFRPLGSEDGILTSSDRDKISIEIGISVGIIYSEVTDLNFYKFQLDLCQNKFRHTPEELMLKYDRAFREHFKDTRDIKGNIIFLIAPFFLLNDDTLDIYFEMIENDCKINPLLNYSLNLGHSLIIFQFDNNVDNAIRLFESLQVENKWEHFLIINATKFAEIININKDFLKSSISFVYVSNHSKLLHKIKQHPNVVIRASELIKSQLIII